VLNTTEDAFHILCTVVGAESIGKTHAWSAADAPDSFGTRVRDASEAERTVGSWRALKSADKDPLASTYAIGSVPTRL